MRSASRRSSFPLMEHPATAAALAAVAGLMNAWTFANVGTFATVQSGNVVGAGYFAVRGDTDRLGAALTSILAFAVGACACAVVVGLLARGGRRYSPPVLAAEVGALLLLIPSSHALPPTWIAVAVSAISGVQGNAFHRDRGMLYGSTAVTFVLQSAASQLGRALIATPPGADGPPLRVAGVYVVVLAAFAGGGAAGALADWLLPTASLALAAVILAVLAGAAVFRRGPVDPRQNAPTP